MNAKKVALLMAIAILIPNTVECFGRRRSRKNKNAEIVSCEFIKTQQVGDAVVAIEPTGQTKRCASCPEFGSKMRSSQAQAAPRPVEDVQRVAQPVSIAKQESERNLSSVKVESPAPVPVKEKAPVAVPTKVETPVKKEVSALKEKEPAKDDAPAPEGELIELISQQEYDDFAKNPAAVIEVYTNSCGVCKTIIPTLKRLAAKYEGKIVFAKVNGQSKAGDKIWKKEKIESVPKFYYYSNGKMVHKSSGGCKADIMEMHLKKAFPTIAG